MKILAMPRVLPALLCGLFLAAGVQAANVEPERIPSEALRADLRLAIETIERLHPDLGHSVDYAAFVRTAGEVEAALDRPMTRDQAWAAFARLNPVLADGHLLVGFPDWRAETRDALARGASLFPFEVVLDGNGDLSIVSALGGEETPLAGQRIRRINDVDARRVVRELLDRTHGDTLRFRTALLSQRWWLYHRKLYGEPARYDIVLAGGAPRRISVPASRAVPALLQREAEFDRQFRFEPLPGRAALLTLGTFDWPDKARFFAFARDAFAEMRRVGTETLVIDVRSNGGGDDDLWRDGILRYIADRPYRTGSRYIKRVLEPYRDEGETVGELVRGEIESVVQPRSDDPLRFRGDVHVLIGPLTYSSAVLFSNVVQDHGFGRLAGTGGAVRSRQSGSVQTLALPNSGLVLSYPRFVLDRPSGGTDRTFLEPDLMVEDDPRHPHSAIDALLSEPGGSRAPGMAAD